MPKESEDKKEERAREGAQAWADYQAEALAVRKKTARLRSFGMTALQDHYSARLSARQGDS